MVVINHVAALEGTVEAPAFMRGEGALPGFPVQLSGSGALLAAFLNESRIRGRVLRSVQKIRV